MMRITRAQLIGDTEYSTTIDISARAYWHDVRLYSPRERGKKIAQLEQAARRMPTGGAAHLLRSLERQGYV